MPSLHASARRLPTAGVASRGREGPLRKWTCSLACSVVTPHQALMPRLTAVMLLLTSRVSRMPFP